MKYQLSIVILAISFCLGSSSCVSQQVKAKSIIDLGNNFNVPNIGSVVHTLGEMQDTINAKVLVNGDTISQIRFTKGFIQGDTVIITAYGLNEATYDELVITMFNSEYTIEYKFEESGVQLDRRMNVKKTKLRLNSNQFERGSIVKGYIEYEAICAQGCINPNYLIVIKGNFHAKLR